MATPTSANAVASGSPQTRVAFRQGVTHAAERQFIMREMVGTSDDSIIVRQEELEKEAGDTIRMRFSPTREQAGYGSTDQVTGTEATVDFTYDDMKIDNVGFAGGLNDVMSQQRIPVKLKAEVAAKFPVMWKRYWERCIMHQLAGYTPANTDAGLAASGMSFARTGGKYRMSGHNAVVAIDAAHTYFANDAANAAAVGADPSLTMSLKYIDEIELRAVSQDYLDYPLLPGPDGYYIAVISPMARRQLRATTTANDWADITRARLEGGESYKNNPIYGPVVGRYSKTVLVVSDYLTRAVATADSGLAEAHTKCVLFLGAKSGCIAYGKGYGGQDHLDWKEQISDYRRWGVFVDSTWGFKRTTFDNLSGTKETYGNMLLVHYSPKA